MTLDLQKPNRDRAVQGRGITVLYVLAVLGGCAAIVVLRWMGFSAILTASVGCGVVLAYAVLAMPFKPRALSTGPIGDNCYYLGFIFTLTSLAWSLYSVGEQRDQGDGFVLEIVSGFGIALLTTAVGVVMRVALNTPRVDLIEEEQAAFQSIRHYYDVMHRDLASLTTSNKQFSLGTRQSIREFQKAFADDLRTEADTRREAIREVVTNAERRLLDRLAALEARAEGCLNAAANRLQNSSEQNVTKAVTALAETAEQRIDAAVEGVKANLATSVEAGTEATETLTTTLEKLQKSTAKLTETAKRTGADVESAAATADAQLEALEKLLDHLEKRELDISRRLERLSDRVGGDAKSARSSASLWSRVFGR